MSVSSVSDDERLLEEESPVERKAGGNRKPQPQQDTSHITTHKAVEYALYLCRVHKHTPDVKIERKAENNELVLLDESVTRNFEDHVQNLCAKTPAQDGVNIRLVLMNPEGGTFLGDKGQILELFQKHWGIDMGDFALLTTQPVASYHSRVVDVHGDMCLDISYNIREDILYDQDNISSLESSLTVNVIKSTNIHIEREYEPVYFRHNISTGQTTYILPNASREQRYLLHNIDQKLSERGGQMHPFTLHAVILFQSLAARSATIDNMLRRLLWIETQIYQGSIFQGTESEKFIQYIQLSHKLSRNLITLEHRNQKDTCLIEKLLGDHKRWWRLTRQCSMSSHSTDIRVHEHVRESLLSLKDSAHDQHRQILSAERKTQLFITLLYNLITGHDSGINLQIASETAKVAHEAKKDSTSMKIIAGVTMFYLPATFVCSLFGTNFVALNTNTSEPTFIVSKLWWVYIAFAVPLTLATIMGFHVWRRWRRGPILVNRMDDV